MKIVLGTIGVVKLILSQCFIGSCYGLLMAIIQHRYVRRIDRTPEDIRLGIYFTKKRMEDIYFLRKDARNVIVFSVILLFLTILISIVISTI